MEITELGQSQESLFFYFEPQKSQKVFTKE